MKASRKYSVKKQFVNFLIHSVFNALEEKLISADLLKLEISQKYGNFDNFEVGKFDHFVEKNKNFKIVYGKVAQTCAGEQKAKCLLESKIIAVHTSKIKCSTSSCNNPRQNFDSHKRTVNWVENISKNQPSNFQLNAYDNISKYFTDFDSSYVFSLVTCKLPASKELSNFANVPWLRVFDFDIESRTNGLLSYTENQIKMKHHLTISTLGDSIQSLSDRATDWFFPLGFSDKPNTVVDKPPYSWYSSNKNLLEQHGSDIANFCTCRFFPVFMILGYDVDENYTTCLEFFLSVLLPYFSPENLSSKIIICTDEKNNDKMNHLIAKYQLTDFLLKLPLQSLCNRLSNVNLPLADVSGGTKLPKAPTDIDSSSVVDLTEHLTWIQQFIDILPVSKNLQENTIETQNIGKDFVKGGIATWKDLENGKAIEREKQKLVFSHLLDGLKMVRKTIGLFKILHTPGGGGTTFARQLIWDLHFELPCGVVVPLPTFSVTQLSERVNFLHEITQLPVVLLVDGRSDYEVEQLYENSKYAVVILHVQRCSYKVEDKTDMPNLNGRYFLPGFVTIKEANQLVSLLSGFVPRKHKPLQELADDVPCQNRFLFEFGLTAFEEFKGVQSYVKGYLNRSKHGFDAVSNMNSWQKVVAYLSLVQYYGQGSLHKEVFHKLLKKSYNTFVSLNDLTHSGQQFVVELNREWKINYFAVAKEILEQILSSTTETYSSELKLSKAARSRLHILVLDFIHMIKCAMGSNTSEHLLQQLSSVILRRDYKEMDAGDVYEKRHSFSRLLEDVTDDSYRIKILETLRDAFPHVDEFHAHLGRMLNIMGQYDEAETSLEKALSLRIAKMKIRGKERPDNVRGRFHHMFGFACRRRAYATLNKFKQHASQSNLIKIMSIIRKAVYHFTEGRKYAMYNRSYGYIGEIRVRLLIADYVHNSKEFPRGCLEAFDGTMDKKNTSLSEFVRESLTVCDELLFECHRYLSEGEVKKVVEIYHWVDTFIQCYKNVGNEKLLRTSSIKHACPRSQIASLKLVHFSNVKKRIPSIYDIKTKKDVEKVVQFYEETIRKKLNSPFQSVLISLDILEWLEAIRHDSIEKEYSLVEVLQIVQAWEKRNEVGFATYYLYILYFLLAIFNPGSKMSLDYYCKAETYKKKLKFDRNSQIQTRVTREWLADHDQLNIKKLICRNKLGTWDKETRFWKDSNSVRLLKVCTGIVIKSSHRSYGVIQLDVHNSRLKIEVAFWPWYYDLAGSRYADQSTPVEFFIGFRADNGAEALSVKKLHHKYCHRCKLKTKVITLVHSNRKGICANCKTMFEDANGELH